MQSNLFLIVFMQSVIALHNIEYAICKYGRHKLSKCAFNAWNLLDNALCIFKIVCHKRLIIHNNITNYIKETFE